MARHYYRVYIGRPHYEAERTTLAREAEARRYAVAGAEANYIVDAYSEQDAIKCAAMAQRGQCLVWHCGPRKAVPVMIPNVEFTGSF